VVIDPGFPQTGKSRLRIGFDARYINDHYHGIGRYAFRLLESLILIAPEFTFIIFRGPDPDTRFDWNSLASWSNVEIQAGPNRLYWPHEQILWPWLMKKNRVDIFHSPYFVAPLFTTQPSIVTVHDLIFDRYPEYMPMSWSRPYYRLLMRLSIRKAQQVISVSAATARDLQSYYPISPEKIQIISEGVDPNFRLAKDPDQEITLRQRYHLDNPYILTVGARRPHKNHANLVKAFAGLPSNLKHDLVFVGPPDARFPDQSRTAVSNSGLQGRVHFLDWVPEEDLPALYSQADLLVLPSLIEGFGLPALEGMVCGTPVVAAKNTSFPEVTGHAGLLVDPTDIQKIRDAMSNVLNNPSLHRRLSQAGRERAAHFTWDSAALQTYQLYQSILHQTRFQTHHLELPDS